MTFAQQRTDSCELDELRSVANDREDVHEGFGAATAWPQGVADYFADAAASLASTASAYAVLAAAVSGPGTGSRWPWISAIGWISRTLEQRKASLAPSTSSRVVVRSSTS